MDGGMLWYQPVPICPCDPMSKPPIPLDYETPQKRETPSKSQMVLVLLVVLWMLALVWLGVFG